MLGPSIQSEIAVPIMLGDGNAVIGVLNVESEELDAFSGFYELILRAFASKVTTLLAFTKLRMDVTEALEVRHANDLLVAIGDNTSNIIHQVNNTVGAMRVMIRELQALQEDGTLPDNNDLRESLDSLLALADRTLNMPQEITRFLTQNAGIVSLNDCVETSAHAVDIPANVDLILDLDSKIPSLPLYSFDIVVQNLLQNAVDAMPAGGRLTVSTALITHPELATGYVQLVVSDTGIGIPDDVLPQVFLLNFTTKHEKRGRGLGLGLWWVRNFVRRADGEITISSEVNAGTKVVVRIPVERSGDASRKGP
jgi:signal transduction histidine kinase